MFHSQSNNRLIKILTSIKTWKIMGVIAIISIVLDIVLYGAFITYEAFQDENNTSFTNFNSIPADLYIAHHDKELNGLKQGIKVKQAQIMNHSCDKNGVKHIEYNPKTSRLEVDFVHQPNSQQRMYADTLIQKFNHSYQR